MIDKKFMKKIGLIIVSVVLFIGCSVSSDTVKMTVASEKQVAVGVAPMDVFLVKEGDATEWMFFYSDIEGFDYESGYEYVLEVKKERVEEPIPADASSIKYILVKEISKIQKESSDLP